MYAMRLCRFAAISPSLLMSMTRVATGPIGDDTLMSLRRIARPYVSARRSEA